MTPRTKCERREADVVGGEDVVDPGVGDGRHTSPLLLGIESGEIPGWGQPDPQRAHANMPPTVSMLS